MKLSHEDRDLLTVLTVRGDLGEEQAEEFRRVAATRLAGQTRDFVLDIAEMGFIDSKGLEALLWLQEKSGERLGQVRLAAAGDSVRKILEITRLAPRFECHLDVESAIQSLR